MSLDRALRVVLLEALEVGRDAASSPDVLALDRQRRADAVEAVALGGAARDAVLLVHVRGALAGVTGTALRQVALVHLLPADDALLLEAAAVAAGTGRALRLLGQLAGDGVAARVDGGALLDGAAVAVLAVLDYAVAAAPSHLGSRRSGRFRSGRF